MDVVLRLSDYVEDGKDKISGLDKANVKEMEKGGVGKIINENCGELIIDCPVWSGFYAEFFKLIGGTGVGKLVNEWKISNSGWTYNFLKEITNFYYFSTKKDAKIARNKGKGNWSNEFNLLVPSIGSTLELTKDWEVMVYDKEKNKGLISLFGLEDSPIGKLNKVILPKGCRLRIDAFDTNRRDIIPFPTMTFCLEHATDNLKVIDGLTGGKITLTSSCGKKKKQPKFLALLSDVNKIKCRIDIDSQFSG